MRFGVAIKANAKDGFAVLRAMFHIRHLDSNLSEIGDWVHEHAAAKRQGYSVGFSVSAEAISKDGHEVGLLCSSREFHLHEDEPPYDDPVLGLQDGPTRRGWPNPWPTIYSLWDDMSWPDCMQGHREGHIILDIINRDLAMLFRLRWQDHFAEVHHLKPDEQMGPMFA